jgi:hypothetical protein
MHNQNHHHRHDQTDQTPFFASWLARLAPMGRRLPQFITPLRQCTLSQIESRFGSFMTAKVLRPPPASRTRRRERPYSVRRTFWCFIWQMLQENTSCREVVRQLQAVLALHGIFNLDEGNSAYVQARQRLPVQLFQVALRDSAAAADGLAVPTRWLQRRNLKAIDGTTLTLADTPENQASYPQPKSQKPGCGFPILRLSVLFSLRSGAVLQTIQGNYYQNEMRLFQSFQPQVAKHDILIYDRAAGNYVVAASAKLWEADLISRVAIRRIDFRKGQRLGKGDRLVVWKKSKYKPTYLTEEQWAKFPEEITVRVINVNVTQKGFRTRRLNLVTTLLDAQLYPLREVAHAFLRRWRLELCLDDLKTTLGMESLKCQSPAMVEKELLAFLIAHNLTRCVMAEAASEHDLDLDRISFKGTLDAFRHFSQAMAQSRTAKQRRRIWKELLRTLADDALPYRPERIEPRAVKRRPKAYPLLNKPRHQYREARHRSHYKPTI